MIIKTIGQDRTKFTCWFFNDNILIVVILVKEQTIMFINKLNLMKHGDFLPCLYQADVNHSSTLAKKVMDYIWII